MRLALTLHVTVDADTEEEGRNALAVIVDELRDATDGNVSEEADALLDALETAADAAEEI